MGFKVEGFYYWKYLHERQWEGQLDRESYQTVNSVTLVKGKKEGGIEASQTTMWSKEDAEKSLGNLHNKSAVRRVSCVSGIGCLRIPAMLNHWLGENFRKHSLRTNVIMNLREADGALGQLSSLQHFHGQNIHFVNPKPAQPMQKIHPKGSFCLIFVFAYIIKVCRI